MGHEKKAEPMANKNPDDLQNQISITMGELESLLGDTSKPDIKVPSRIIPMTAILRSRFSFVKSKVLARNISYAVQSIAFYRWLLRRFNLYGPVKSYVVKAGIVLNYMIVEAMIHDFLKQKNLDPSKEMGKNLKKLENSCGFHPWTCKDIKKLHDRRANIHLYLVTDLENDKYNVNDWNNSIAIRKRVEDTIRKKLL